MERVHLLHPDVHINATLWGLVQDKAKQLGISTDASNEDLRQYVLGNLTIEECIKRNRYRYGLNNA